MFVVGIQNFNEVMQCYKEEQCEHIFFGANHSYTPVTSDEFEDWDLMIRAYLDQDILCSLDIEQWGYNTMVKVDDKDFNASNPGVWCHSLHSLMARNAYTPWSAYTKDKVINNE